jgi:hypothetical protein
MVLCASSKEGKDVGGVELCDVPEGSQPGDRIYFEGFEDEKALECVGAALCPSWLIRHCVQSAQPEEEDFRDGSGVLHLA